MTEIKPPTLSEMEESLEHYGVKGMRWGVRRSTDDGGSSSAGGIKPGSIKPASKVALPSPERAKAVAIPAAKAAKKAVDLGALPLAATALGLGFPTVALLGMAVKAATDPHIQEAVKSAGRYASELVSQIGDTTLGEMRKGT